MDLVMDLVKEQVLNWLFEQYGLYAVGIVIGLYFYFTWQIKNIRKLIKDRGAILKEILEKLERKLDLILLKY